MKIIVHQAIYGEQNRGHSLLAKSLGNDSLFADLMGFTDLPGNLVGNTEWQPYLSCFSFGDYYIISRTFPDPSASRAGMVLAHLLAIKLQDAIRCSDIGSLIEILPTTPERRDSISSVEFESTGNTMAETEIVTKLGARYSALLHALIYKRNRAHPVVWIGLENFEQVVRILWRALWPEARKQFSCRISFGPQDIEGHNLMMVVTPSELQHRWAGYPVVQTNELQTNETPAIAFMVGAPGASGLRKFVEELGASLVTLGDLEKLEGAYLLFQSMPASRSADEVRMLARRLGEFVPAKKEGASLKNQVLKSLAELTASGTVSDIKALRNFDISAFENGSTVIGQSIQTWIGSRVQSETVTDAKEQAELLERAFDLPKQEWNELVQRAMRATLSNWRTQYAPRVWDWWKHAANLVSSLSKYLPDNDRVETDLANSCPARLNEKVGDAVVALCAERKWYVLHAFVLNTYCEPHEAVQKQLTVDINPKYFDGLRALFARIPAAVLLLEAVERDDGRLWALAGEACALDSDLFAGLDVNKYQWREIWRYRMNSGGDVWEGVEDPSGIVFRLMDLILAGDSIEDTLLERLAVSPYGDLTEYPSRRAIWLRLRTGVAPAFLNSTAEGWLDRFAVNADFDMSIEAPLEDTVLERNRLARRLDPAQPNSISFGLNLFQRFSRLSQSDFEQWLAGITTNVKSIDVAYSTLIGTLVKSRHWGRVATKLLNYVTQAKRLDLIPALSESYNLLDLFDTILLKFSGRIKGYRISWDDWWVAFTETAVELYPRGPEEMKIWERSGGDSSVIAATAPGREGWQQAMHKLRNGGGGKKISTTALMRNMGIDFPRKDKIDLLWRMWSSLGGQL